MPYVGALIAGFFGAVLEGWGGFVFLGALGLLAGLYWQQSRDITRLKEQVAGLLESGASPKGELAQESARATAGSEASDRDPSPTTNRAELQAHRTTGSQTQAPQPQTLQSTDEPTQGDNDTSSSNERRSRAQSRSQSRSRGARAPREPNALDTLIAEIFARAKAFFTTGNVVVRVGVVVLFFGVAFLLNYAYENSHLPLQLRLAAAGLGGIILAAIGWRLRSRSDTYGLILQGAGVGMLYLTIFAAARLYELIPMSVAFGLLVALVIASSILAVLQKSQALAMFSMAGGFLAPVLVSTGAGSHVGLFSYYALLNGGIFLMAWFQFWRWLNWIGFLFTFVIGATWGYQYYEPEYFASTEPFLILFFLYYLGVSVLFARRREVDLRGVVDGTLVFGTPIVAFALQAALVQHLQFGLAFSALGAGATYLGLALWLKRQHAFSDLLGQSFVALAVVFATLAIPFAFDNQRFTAATWAIEGAGLFWVGLRQVNRLPRFFGMLLQFAAALAFVSEGMPSGDATLFLNSTFLGAALMSIAAGYTAYLISTNVGALHKFEIPLRWPFLGWAVLWWFIGGAREIERYVPSGAQAFKSDQINENLMILFTGMTFAFTTLLARRVHWRDGLLPGVLLLPVLAFALFSFSLDWDSFNVFGDFGWLAWPVAVGAFAYNLRSIEHLPRIAVAWHAGGWWLLTFLATATVASLTHNYLPKTIWPYVLWGAIPGLVSFLILRARVTLCERMHSYWPFEEFADSYFGWGWAAMLGYLLAFVLVSGAVPGDPAPLAYIVILNPLELVQVAIVLVGYMWIGTLGGTALASVAKPAKIALAVIGFAWLNFTVARAVHFYASAPYPLDRIVETDAFQTTISIVWTVASLALMGIGTRRVQRSIWVVGAALLGLVILKLFTIDLSNLEMVARIISFITVGILMLIIGYFAPIPPNRKQESE